MGPAWAYTLARRSALSGAVLISRPGKSLGCVDLMSPRPTASMMAGMSSCSERGGGGWVGGWREGARGKGDA